VKLSCCILVRDDESTLEACLESIRPHVDELCVLDTGSADNSPAIAKKYADKWELFLGCNDEQNRIADFAMARNQSFAMATGDWICWFDADDIVVGGENLRALCAEATAEYHQWLLPYEYSRDANGNVTCLQLRERLMRPPHALRWKSPVHEYCAFDTPGIPVTSVATDRVTVVHHSHLSKKKREPHRNLRILKDYVARVGETDVRALYYLGIEYAAAGDVGNSLRWLKRYVQLADWDDEKCKALLAIGEHYRSIGDHAGAEEWTTQALTTKSWPEPYFALGRSFYAMAQRGERPDYNYRRATFFISRGLELPTDVVLFANPQERFLIHTFLNVCFHATGDLDRALQSCQEGLKGFPAEVIQAVKADPAAFQGHPCAMLETNRCEYAKAKYAQCIRDAAMAMQAEGGLTEMQVGLIRAVLKGELKIETPEAKEAAGPAPTKLEPQKADPGKLDIVLFLGPALERWSPETFAKTGMGGSETMAWEMARRLRARGHRVRFYTDCTAAQEGVYEGVEWLQWPRFRGVECDVLIASRFPWAVDDEVDVNFGEGSSAKIGGCKATVRCLWVHDVHVGDQLDLRRSQRFDRILCLTEWHKQFFLSVYNQQGTIANIPESKVIVTRNGVSIERFDGTEERNPHRAVYSSSPDRGLLAALQAWPKVREKVGDAELHIFYGFGNWEKSTTDPKQVAVIAHLKHLAKTTPGVVLRDRVHQAELAREFLRAGVWLHPTWFSETSCIGAMEAQAAGLYAVTAPIAALNETVGERGYMIKESWGDFHTLPPPPPRPEFVEEVAAATIAAMTGEWKGPSREELMQYARDHLSLDALADDWSEMLLRLNDEMGMNPVGAFGGKAAE
jgi:glycosyltransferase involved in cell wall biosynthesis